VINAQVSVASPEIQAEIMAATTKGFGFLHPVTMEIIVPNNSETIYVGETLDLMKGVDIKGSTWTSMEIKYLSETFEVTVGT